ncbi:MAG TPA: carboxypeptidase regulatory-like domain-containing protein [Candidatus Acidoferrum sp.]|nr:carboxypeptidase regulatory-like domain-containing protein [Candidatus Acidoferrum sp.]
MDRLGRQKLLFPVVILTFLLTATVARAQGVGASGEITGTVTDSTGAVLPKATVTVVNPETGLRREAISNDSGQYFVPGLSPATYEVRAQFSGFGTGVRKGVTVTIGETAVCDFSLRPQSETVIEVKGEAIQIETQRASQANTITQSYIINLPIDRRDYLTFTLLAPGVSSSDRTTGDQDFRVKQTPQSGLSFYGSNGRGNSITVDGGETSGDSGGVRPTVSQDAVQEFQVKRSNFGPELGSATGASINIVTKSGTNKVHGGLFGFFRNDAMDAANPFSYSQALQPGQTFDPAEPDLVGSHIKDTLSRQQFGGSMGFPLQKDKTFAFVAFEGLLGNAQNAVPILTDTSVFRPTADQDAIIGQLASQSGNVTCFPGVPQMLASTCAFALNSILTVNPNPGANPFISTFQGAMNGFLVNQFETQGGVFPFITREYLASGRLDHRFNESNQVSLTYRFAHDVEQSPDVHSLTAFSAGSSTHTQDHNLQGAWFHLFGTTAQNELRIQWNHEDFNVLPNVPGEVGLQIPGFINNLGTSIFLPNFTTLRRTEYADNFTLFHGHHVLQFGGAVVLRGNDTSSNTFLPGRFVFGTLPGALISPELASTTINPLQAASFGLPQFYQQGFGNPQYPYYSRPLTGLYFRDSWTITPGFVVKYGLRYELDSQFEPLGTYTKDFAPRISFSWDPFKNQKTVIRGGYGIFYSPIDVQIPDVDMSLGALNSNRTTVENSAGAGQVANLLSCGVTIAGGYPLIPATSSSPCNREISIYVDPITSTGIPGLQTAPVVFQTLFGQGLIQCTTPAAGNQACITPASVLPLGIRVANSGPISPLQVVFVNQPGYRPPIAQQVSLGIEREITTGFSIALSGIYTHTQRLPIAIDTNLLPAGFSTLTLANGNKVSYRNWNTNPAADPAVLLNEPGYTEPCAASPQSCFANQLVVQNNQYSSVASALYEGVILEVKQRFSNHFTLFGNYTYSKAYDNSTDYNTDYGPQDPTNIGLDRSLSEFDERHKVVVAGVFQSPWKSPFLSGFELAPIFSYHSGHPFNLLASGVSVNGDNHTTNERPIGAPRDTGLGPDYIDLDMRLSWRHKTGEWGELQITAEGFNIANRVNYSGVNNEVSPLFGFQPGFTTFNVHGLVPGSPLPGGGTVTPSTPLAFTSAQPMRQVQLGIRFTF